jgi:hypothetical protein
MVAVPYNVRNYAANGPLFPNPVAKIYIHGVIADTAGIVGIVDGTGKTVLHLVFGAAGSVMFGNGAVVCEQGGTLTLTTVTNCSLVMTP